MVQQQQQQQPPPQVQQQQQQPQPQLLFDPDSDLIRNLTIAIKVGIFWVGCAGFYFMNETAWTWSVLSFQRSQLQAFSASSVLSFERSHIWMSAQLAISSTVLSKANTEFKLELIWNWKTKKNSNPWNPGLI